MVEAGAYPTYLTTSEVAESAPARRALLDCLANGVAEIGAHFHTWTRTWPFETPALGDPPLQAMAHQLGQQIEERMLSYTCAALVKAFGRPPTSYRGGRWSLGRESTRSLINCGIEVDSTVTPGLTWADSSSRLVDGPDYRCARRGPYWLEGPEGHSQVLEIPVGAAWFPSAGRRLPPFPRRVLSKVRRLAGLRGGHCWLRPTRVSVSDMRATMESLKSDGIPVWVFMIHSSEIVPCQPLSTHRDVDAFVDRCIGAIRCAIELGAEPATLTEAARWLKQSLPRPPARTTAASATVQT